MTAQNSRSTVQEEHSLAEFSSLAQLIELLERKGVTDFENVEFFSYDEGGVVEFERPETNVEMNRRVERLKRLAAAAEKQGAVEKERKERRDRAEYERLKKKFG